MTERPWIFWMATGAILAMIGFKVTERPIAYILAVAALVVVHSFAYGR